MSELKRITTEYIDMEDRMRLTGETEDGNAIVLWLTAKLLQRLLPHLFKWLEQQADKAMPATIVQSFAQQAAKAGMAPEPPVKQQEDTPSWLVHAVDVNHEKGFLQLTFRAPGQEQQRLQLPTQQLRQWLSITQMQWLRAGWPKDLWPDWMEAGEPGKAQLALH
ncbi:MAG: hypothetical protein Q8L60_10975 [Gammaproteobacteria bacterium]|nr:hypothetical protein [Gammaproteobacteria bacterium]MDP2139745.1 hypothetical protein [Gammaproteobacteria bacterium]MDP2348948.1 hypothetical protein [Gammaproteobacteria bacterium]